MKLKALIIFLFWSISFKGTGQTLEVYKRVIDIPKSFLYDEFSHGLQDSKGFIWLTTSKGSFVRFDNQKLKRYGSEHGLPKGGQWDILEDSENNVFIHINWTDRNKKRHFIFNPIEEKAITLAQYTEAPIPFDENHVRKTVQNSDGSIWFYLFNGDIFELNDKKVSYWGTVRDDSGHNVIFKSSRSLAYTHQGVGDERYVVITSPNRQGQKRHEIPTGCGFSRFLEPSIFESDEGGALAIITDHSTNSKKLLRCTYDTIEVLDSVVDEAADYNIFDHKIWRVSGEKGVLFDQNMKMITTWKHPRTDPLIFFDKQGGWWTVGGRGKLKRMYTKRLKFHHYNHSIADLPWHTAARGIIATKKGELFISKGGALTKINPNGEVEFLHPPWTTSTSGDYYGLHIEKGTDYLWVANGATLDRFNISTGLFDKSHGLEQELSSVLQSYHDQLGQFWVGGSFGICKWNAKKNGFEKFEGYPGYELPEKLRVFYFYENEKGMWIATGEGLFLFDIINKTIECFSVGGTGKNYLPNNVISHLQEDVDGTFWLSSKGGGLIHWNPETGNFEQFTTQNGLKNDVIYACYQDDFNQIWLPSDNGLMQFDKSTKQVIHYTENDGIPDREFNTISHYEDSLGQLYFGGLNGVIRFHPKDFTPKPNPYNLEISAFQKTNSKDSVYTNDLREILPDYQISILPDDKEAEIKFALLNFEDPTEWAYEYKLEGLHINWKSLETPMVDLHGIPYGEYKLHFRCRMHGYNWKEYEHPITVVVVTPYYRTWWFITLIVVGLILGIWVLLRWRLSAARKRERELEEQVHIRTREISAQAEELKSLDKMKTQFFANISHELRTPLTLILGPVREMKSKKESALDSFQINKNLDVIDRNAEKLLGLIEEVLSLSKLDAGKLSINEEPTSLIDFSRYIKSNFQTNAELNRIQFRLNFDLSAKSSFYIDQAKTETILTNFLSNAFKFCGENGEVIFSVEEKESTIIFGVKDKGIGIREEDLPHVFDRFFQVSLPGNTANGGTGIGLALCKELAEIMNGRVWVDSTYGEGSSFYLELPVKEAPDEKPEVKASISRKEEEASIGNDHIHTEKSLILLVEDNPDMSNYIQSILNENYSVITASNGAEGLRTLEKQGEYVDLVISDVMMPVMDGFSMLERMKKDERWFNFPVIMLTARASEKDKLQALTIGADDYLIKPFSSSELLARIQNLIANYESRKLWQNSLTRAVESISTQAPTSKSTEEKEDQKNEISKKDLQWLKKVEQHINQELMNEEFDIQLLSEKMFLSKRQFERRIKLLTGLTPAKLVLEIRLKKGRKYLEDGHFASVSEVSYAIGIQTPGYFSKLYARRFGKRPSSYFK